MNPMKQQNQDAITLAALQQVIESNSCEIENRTSVCAEMCLSMKSKVNTHYQSTVQLFTTLEKYNNSVLSNEFKKQWQSLFSAVNELYDQEYMKCCHSVTNNCFEETSFNETDDDNIILSMEDVLDERIKKLESEISHHTFKK